MINTVANHLQTHASKYAWAAVAVAMIAPFEGYYGHPYRDSVGVETICYGATAADGVDFSKTYTKGQCLVMLQGDLPKYDAPLKKCIVPEVYNALPPHRHAALVSLAYNIGPAGVCRSSVVRDLNAGNLGHPGNPYDARGRLLPGACNDFLKFDKGGGRVIQGLVNRRRAERVACLRED
jgi:lysozyme